MSKQHYQTLFSYTSHTTRRLLDVAALLDEAEYRAHFEFGQRSVHDLFFHMLSTARSWRISLETGQQPAHLQAEEFPTLDSIAEGFAQERAAWHSMLEGLDDAQIDGPIELKSLRGDAMSIPIWRVFQHLVLHGMQHHTEIAQLLTAKGHSPGDIDFIFYQG